MQSSRAVQQVISNNDSAALEALKQAKQQDDLDALEPPRYYLAPLMMKVRSYPTQLTADGQHSDEPRY